MLLVSVYSLLPYHVGHVTYLSLLPMRRAQLVFRPVSCAFHIYVPLSSFCHYVSYFRLLTFTPDSQIVERPLLSVFPPTYNLTLQNQDQ